jgi:hypothetical protein
MRASRSLRACLARILAWTLSAMGLGKVICRGEVPLLPGEVLANRCCVCQCSLSVSAPMTRLACGSI